MRSQPSYGGLVPNRDGTAAERPTPWAAFLDTLVERPGWSVARLARESKINKSTIFRWLAGRGGLNVNSVRSIAEGAGVDIAEAMLAAGQILGVPEQDPEIRAIVDSQLSEAVKQRLLATVRTRRLRELENTRLMVELAEQGGQDPDVG